MIETALWGLTFVLILINYFLVFFLIGKEKKILQSLRNAVRTRRDLLLVGEAAQISKNGALIIVLSFLIYLIAMIALGYIYGIDFHGITSYFFVYGVVTLPVSFYAKSVEKKLKKLPVLSDDPEINESYRSLLIQWAKPVFKIKL